MLIPVVVVWPITIQIDPGVYSAEAGGFPCRKALARWLRDCGFFGWYLSDEVAVSDCKLFV